MKKLNPNFVVIAFEFSRIPSSIIIHEDNRWIILVISIFQIIFFLFYLEIIEYNFCSLNKNTKRSILERELKLKDGYNGCDDNNTDEISFHGYDVTEGFKDVSEKSIEL